jgi:ATP-dependent Clp protease ATP-binding subunit ClpC
MDLSLREALSLGHNYIGTEHILLGLVRENGGVAARILLDFDTDAEKIRNETIRMLSGPDRAPTGSGPAAGLFDIVRAEKERAIEAQDFERAAELLEHERRLLREAQPAGGTRSCSAVRHGST